MASKERNALAELADALCEVVVDNRHYTTVGEYGNAEDALKKSIRIIDELAKVLKMERTLEKENKDFLPVSIEMGIRCFYQTNCINRCREIAEEGATNDER